MENIQPLETLNDIRTMMNRSSRFLSLNGFAGVVIGTLAIVVTWLVCKRTNSVHLSQVDVTENIEYFCGLAIGTLCLALLTAFIFTKRKANKIGEKLWNDTAKIAGISFFIPLFIGGVLCLALLKNGYVSLLAPTTLIFYGIACICAGKHTYNAVRYMGFCEAAIGLLCAFFLDYSLIFWMLGFGVLHIVYGLFIYIKYDR